MSRTETPRPDSLDTAIERFLVAFRNLDWEPFIASFADDASVFFPFPDQPRRATGITEIRAIFAPFFDRIRQQRPGPPYLQLEPVDLQVVLTGASALVTFHLNDPDALCRRTLIWTTQEQQWLILHLHASNVPYGLKPIAQSA